METKTFENISLNETIARIILGAAFSALILLTSATPAVIFALSIMSLYLIISAIASFEPLYALVGMVKEKYSFSLYVKSQEVKI